MSYIGRWPNRIVARRIVTNTRVYELIDVHEIAYIFRGSAAGRRKLIDARWVNLHMFAPNGIYFRTVGGVTYRTPGTSLTVLQERHKLPTFMAINQGVLANANHIAQLDFANKLKLVGFQIRAETECLHVSRREAGKLARMFGLVAGRRRRRTSPPRSRRPPGPHGRPVFRMRPRRP